MRLAPFGLTVLACLALPAAPPTWTPLGQDRLSNTVVPALARTADGVLHVAWVAREQGLETLRHSLVAPDGNRVSAGPPVVRSWKSLSSPALVVGREGLTAYFAGMRTLESSDPLGHGTLACAQGGATGSAWQLDPKPRSKSESVYATGCLGATTQQDGTPVVAWAYSGGTFAAVGAQLGSAVTRFQEACCGYWPTLATDARSGEVALAWFSNDTKTQGLRIQTLGGGSATLAPQCLTSFNGRTDFVMPAQPAALSGRIGAEGLYAAYGSGYPTATRALLWKLGTPTPLEVARGPVQHVALAAGPEGRLWVFWKQGTSVFATRSNRAVSRFGATVSAKAPAESLWRLAGDGARGPLDVIALLETAGKGADPWHVRLLPGLEVQAVAGKDGQTSLTVTDAGDPVEGVTLLLAGQEARTDAHGQARVKAPRGAKGVARVEGHAESPFQVR